MAVCPFCDTDLASGPPWAPGPGYRLAYDPEKGRLWNVCTGCSKWVLTPMESRWETLESCEEAVQTRGEVRLSTPHLSLVEVEDGYLIRVGAPPRQEFVDWRYGPKLVDVRRRPPFWHRLLAKLPAPPVGGYDPYKGFEGAVRSEPWLASPFLEYASSLTYVFSQIPLAPNCPSCQGPLALKPWDFQEVEFLTEDGRPLVLAHCSLCSTDVTLDLSVVRPVLRLGVSLITPPSTLQSTASGAAGELDALGGALHFLKALATTRTSLGDLDIQRRAGLIISLDEMAEMDALEAEWRAAEEIATIMDGELTDVLGFETFRRQILDRSE